MKVEQKLWRADQGWVVAKDEALSDIAQLVLAFGSKKSLDNASRFDELREYYPNVEIVTCSTAGEILAEKAIDDSITVSALYFEKK